MAAASRLMLGGCLFVALYACCGQQALAQSVGNTQSSAAGDADQSCNDPTSKAKYVNNPLDFDHNDTLELVGDKDCPELKDYHNFNTGLVVDADGVVEAGKQVQFGGAVNNSDGLPVDQAQKLFPESYGYDESSLGSMLVLGPNSELSIVKHLGFAIQCTNENNGGGDDPSAGCQEAAPVAGNQVSNDYLGINGRLDVGDYLRSWGGDDVVFINGSDEDNINIPGGKILIGSDMDLGDGDDQIVIQYNGSLDVGTDLILGNGKDRFVSRGKVEIGGNFTTGSGDDQVEIRGESPVGYGSLTVEGSVELGEGNDTFLLKAPLDLQAMFTEVRKKLSFGAGDDVLDVRLASTRLLVGTDRKDNDFNINFGEGNDRLINEGDIFSEWGIVFNGGDVDDGSDSWGDAILNYENAKISTYAGINFSESGRGTIDNQGIIEVALSNPEGRQIIFGVGDDRIINRSGGVIDVNGYIRMGDGDDLILNDGVMDVSEGIQMGDGDDLLRIGGGCLIRGGQFDRCLSLGEKKVVNGGNGIDSLEFSDENLASNVSFGVDASQQSTSRRQLIVATDVAGRYVNFESLIQGAGSFRYEGNFSENFDRLIIREGVFIASESSPVTFQDMELRKEGTIIVGMDGSGDRSPINVSDDKSGGFLYSGGEFVISVDSQNDPRGSYFVIEGNVLNANSLAENVSLLYDCDVLNEDCTQQQFSGLGPDNGVDAALSDVYLKEGSLQIVVEPKDPGTFPVTPDDPGDPDVNDDGELDQLPGCDVGDDLCDVISDVPGDEDDATDQEEDLSADVIDGLIDGWVQDEIELPLINYGTLARLVGSGLLPRNVDAPGRSLFNYNNLLVDTVFERLPLRQFRSVEVSAVVEEDTVIVEPDAEPPAEPVRGLWSRTEGLDEQEAQQFLDQRLAQADAVLVEQQVIELDGVVYEEDPSLTAQYANRDGVRAWYRAFGGDIGPTQTSTLYGNYTASAGGMVLGADVSIGSNVQIGAFANYGDVSLNQFAGDTGSGAWNPSGWGGGFTADWWTNNFYVQGLVAASGFSGSQSRDIIAINKRLGDDEASGDKSVTSYAYALRLGAPFQAGSVLLEPQFTAAWTQNQEDAFRENGADWLNLRYGSRTTNFLQTELGLKLALPIRSGERGEWVPNLRLAWLGDWNQNNQDQSIRYSFTDKTVGVPSDEVDNNGVLIEGGLDYTMANINSGSWKLYVRGGAELWGGDRGTDWRASGGVTWQF